MRTLFRHPRRVWHVLSVFYRFFIAPALHLPGGDKRSGPVRLRLAFQRLGGAWIKLGQMLALRFDLLPAAYCDELFKLLNQVEPFSYDEVREIIRQELGADPETIFQSFSHESFAAASIGQVHRAVLHSGEAVAVKVQRPGIRTTLGADIELMYASTRILDWTHVFGATRSREVIDEFARWTADELDYLVEARQAVLLYQNAQGGKGERIARVHRDYTTSRVLTTELIVGIPLIDVMIAKREGTPSTSRRSPPRATTWTGSSAPSTGTCSTRSTSSATSTPTCTRPTCSSCPATRSATSTSGSSASCPIASGTP